MKRDPAIKALNMAITFRAVPKGCMHHTDRGSQYCSHDYQKILGQHGFKVSMSGKGNCYGNAAIETFIKNYQDRTDLAQVLGNTQASRDSDLRIHQRLLQSAPTTLSTGLEKPRRIRTEGGLNEHSGQHKNVTGQVCTKIYVQNPCTNYTKLRDCGCIGQFVQRKVGTYLPTVRRSVYRLRQTSRI